MAFRPRYLLAFAWVLGWATAPLAGADLAADKQQEVDALNESVDEAARLFQKSKYKDCAAIVRSVQQKCEELSMLLGNVSQATLQQTGERGESLLAKVGQFLAASPEEPWVKGRVTLFLLEKREDYTRFGTQVEKQSPPAGGDGP